MNRMLLGPVLSILVGVAVLPATLASQQAPAVPGALNLPPEAQALIVEMTQIQNQLRPMQQRAMEDPSIREEGDALGETIIKAMEEVEPSTPELIARINALAPQLEAAQAAQDEPRFRTLISEASEIDQILQIAREEAVQLPEVLAKVEAFEAKVHSKMVADNPSADAMLKRLDELNGQLAALLR